MFELARDVRWYRSRKSRLMFTVAAGGLYLVNILASLMMGLDYSQGIYNFEVPLLQLATPLILIPIWCVMERIDAEVYLRRIVEKHLFPYFFGAAAGCLYIVCYKLDWGCTIPTILIFLSIFIAPISIRRSVNAGKTVAIESIVFICVFSIFPTNSWGIVVITAYSIVAMAMILFGNFKKTDAVLHFCIYLCVLQCLYLFRPSGVLDVFESDLIWKPIHGPWGRINDYCRYIFSHAKFFGELDLAVARDVICGRTLTYILSRIGWLGLVPIIALECFLLVYTFKICKSNYGLLVLFAATLIAAQMLFYILACFGIDPFFTPLWSPFLSGEFDGNLLSVFIFLILGRPGWKPRLFFLRESV